MWESRSHRINAETELRVLATDIKTTVLRRAEDALYLDRHSRIFPLSGKKLRLINPET